VLFKGKTIHCLKPRRAWAELSCARAGSQ